MESVCCKNLRFAERDDDLGDNRPSKRRPSLNRKKTPGPTVRNSRRKTMFPSYSEKSANEVGKRIAGEVQSPVRLALRSKKEATVDTFLYRIQMVYYANRVYRLTDSALVLLEKRLLSYGQKLNDGRQPLIKPCPA